MSKTIGIIVGSLRKGSFTGSIAKELHHQLPAGFEGKMVDIGQLPLYNQDFDAPGSTPESYDAFRSEIEGLDGFIFVTPEHNRSYPAALKNALDIASRPYGANKWGGKPALVVSASPGPLAGFGANHHLRQVLAFLNVNPVQQPEAYLSNVHTLLDEQGNVKLPETKAFLKTLVEALAAKFR